MRNTLLIILLLVNAPCWSAQDTLQISKIEFVEKVTKGSYQQFIAEKEAMMAQADYQKSNALYLPKVTASYTAMTTNNPLMAFGSKLNQEVLTPQDFDPALLNDPANIENYATEILVLQPLLNLDGVYERNAARIQKEAFQLKAERTKQYLELESAKLYMQLQLAYEAVGVLQRAQISAHAAVEMVTDYFEQGLVQKADVLDAKVKSGEVANQLGYARSNLQNTSDQLLILMGMEPGTATIKPEAEALLDHVSHAHFWHLPENRKDVLAISKSVDGYANMLKSSKMKFMPRVNAFGSFQIYDGQPFGFGASGHLLGARLSWDLFSGYSNVANISKIRLETEKAALEKEEYMIKQQAELMKVNRMLADSKNKVQVSETAFDQASEAYKIRKDRFEQGLEKTVDLLMAESQMVQMELQLRQAIFEYNFTKEYLHFLTRE